MAGTLVVAELSEGKVKKSTHSAITFAKQVGAPFAILAIGAGAGGCRQGARGLRGAEGARRRRREPRELHGRALRADGGEGREGRRLGHGGPRGRRRSARTSAPRVAAKLAAGYAPDINRVKVDGGKRTYRRPQYAGNALGWLEITTPVHVVSVRQTEFAGGGAERGRQPRRERRRRRQTTPPPRASSS